MKVTSMAMLSTSRLDCGRNLASFRLWPASHTSSTCKQSQQIAEHT